MATPDFPIAPQAVFFVLGKVRIGEWGDFSIYTFSEKRRGGGGGWVYEV